MPQTHRGKISMEHHGALLRRPSRDQNMCSSLGPSTLTHRKHDIQGRRRVDVQSSSLHFMSSVRAMLTILLSFHLYSTTNISGTNI
eukprot:6104621-Pleurochrysis_carterae.AAC.4